MFRFFSIIALLTHSVWGFELVLDIGHTPTKSGATSSNCEKEFNYNLSLGNYLMEHLPSNSTIKMSKPAQREITFDDRYASSIHKELFLSIHHDSVQERYIQRNSFGCPSTDYASGFSIFISRKNPYFNNSLIYAKKFGQALIGQGLVPSWHHAEKIAGENRELIDPKLGIYLFDDLKVLKNAHSPAILFEAGVIVNPADEAILRGNTYKNKVSKAINEAFEI